MSQNYEKKHLYQQQSSRQYDGRKPKNISSLPDFSKYYSLEGRKNAFISYMLPIIREENGILRKKREYIKKYISRDIKNLSVNELELCNKIALEYKINIPLSHDNAEELISRVDEIPISIALAQAAIESAWGTSRFAKDGNNIFGQWCFSDGCGIIPKRRNKNAVHEIAKYDDVKTAVKKYMHNLNTHIAYDTFRKIRALRLRGVSNTPLEYGLINYSERGKSYVLLVSSVIRKNNLKRFDK